MSSVSNKDEPVQHISFVLAAAVNKYFYNHEPKKPEADEIDGKESQKIEQFYNG